MARKSLVNVVADGLLDRIVSGELAIGEALPTEAEIGEEFEVSRVTVREALRILTAQGVVRVESGIGSHVRPVDEWTSLDSLMRYRSAHSPSDDTAVQLIEVRRMFETEAAALAATRLSDESLHELEQSVARMVAASEFGDVDDFVAADLHFHDVIMRASGNIFLSALFEPLTRVLAERRAETSRVPQIQHNAIEHHRAILEALRGRRADAARAAMHAHMEQTLNDLKAHVLGN